MTAAPAVPLIRGERIPCLASPVALRREAEGGRGAASRLARDYDVSRDTAARWLVEAGLAEPDLLLTPEILHDLYLEQGLSVRAIASRYGVGNNRVLRALSSAEISTRARKSARLRNAVPVDDDMLRELYVNERLNVDQLAIKLGVSRYQAQQHVNRLGLTKRRGSHTPRSHLAREELRRQTAELYESGLRAIEISERLGVSVSTVRDVIREAGTPQRGRSGGTTEQPQLLHRLYGDRKIAAVLRRHAVTIPKVEDWQPVSPWKTYAPMPLDAGLLRELYVKIGLSTRQVAMVCGVSAALVRTRMRDTGVPARPSGSRAPWVGGA